MRSTGFAFGLEGMHHFTEDIKKSIRMRLWQPSLLLTAIHQHPLSSTRKCKKKTQIYVSIMCCPWKPEPVISSRRYGSRTAATYIPLKDRSKIWFFAFLLQQRLLKIYLTLKWPQYLVKCAVDQGWSGCRATFNDFTRSAATHSGTNKKVIVCHFQVRMLSS